MKGPSLSRPIKHESVQFNIYTCINIKKLHVICCIHIQFRTVFFYKCTNHQFNQAVP